MLAKQAWRAGFREGVKMGLDRGTKFSSITFSEEVYWQNLHRLMIWQMVGADVTNGIWAMYGARQGCYMTNLTDWDYVQVRDFAYLETLWEDVKKQITPDNILSECTRLGKLLHQTLQIPVDQVLSVNQSKMFKYSYTNTDRTGQGFIDIE